MRSIFAYAAAGLLGLGLTGLIPDRAAAAPVPAYSYNYVPANFTATRWVPSRAMGSVSTYNLFPVAYGSFYGPGYMGYYSYTPVYRSYYPVAPTYYAPAYPTYYYTPAPTYYSYVPPYPGPAAYNNTTGTTFYFNTGP
jgi:morphogenetic protein associated with SpoVID